MTSDLFGLLYFWEKCKFHPLLAQFHPKLSEIHLTLPHLPVPHTSSPYAPLVYLLRRISNFLSLFWFSSQILKISSHFTFQLLATLPTLHPIFSGIGLDSHLDHVFHGLTGSTIPLCGVCMAGTRDRLDPSNHSQTDNVSQFLISRVAQYQSTPIISPFVLYFDILDLNNQESLEFPYITQATSRATQSLTYSRLSIQLPQLAHFPHCCKPRRQSSLILRLLYLTAFLPKLLTRILWLLIFSLRAFPSTWMNLRQSFTRSGLKSTIIILLSGPYVYSFLFTQFPCQPSFHLRTLNDCLLDLGLPNLFQNLRTSSLFQTETLKRNSKIQLSQLPRISYSKPNPHPQNYIINPRPRLPLQIPLHHQFLSCYWRPLIKTRSSTTILRSQRSSPVYHSASYQPSNFTMPISIPQSAQGGCRSFPLVFLSSFLGLRKTSALATSHSLSQVVRNVQQFLQCSRHLSSNTYLTFSSSFGFPESPCLSSAPTSSKICSKEKNSRISFSVFSHLILIPRTSVIFRRSLIRKLNVQDFQALCLPEFIRPKNREIKKVLSQGFLTLESLTIFLASWKIILIFDIHQARLQMSLTQLGPLAFLAVRFLPQNGPYLRMEIPSLFQSQILGQESTSLATQDLSSLIAKAPGSQGAADTQ